jgi:hypothetical protein
MVMYVSFIVLVAKANAPMNVIGYADDNDKTKQSSCLLCSINCKLSRSL